MSKAILTIKEDYLKELIDYCSSSLVGKLMKRFEVFDDTNYKEESKEAWFRKTIKKEAKELIYESYRNFKELVISHDKGIDISIFSFKRPDSTEK